MEDFGRWFLGAVILVAVFAAWAALRNRKPEEHEFSKMARSYRGPAYRGGTAASGAVLHDGHVPSCDSGSSLCGGDSGSDGGGGGGD